MPRHRALPNHSGPARHTRARHRARSNQSRTLSGVTATVTVTGAVTGAALGASALAAAPAYAATSEAGALGSLLSGQHGDSQASSHHRRYRPMTSGEEQYRNGCRQGYISDDCEQFSVPNLLRHGIDPYL